MEVQRLKAQIIVNLEVSDLVDRLFVPSEMERELGLSDLFQEAVKLTVLDRRHFSPPIESKEDRALNLSNTMETFGISRDLTARIFRAGFRSTTLMAMAEPDFLVSHFQMTKNDLANLTTMLKMINCSPLEPLYSLNRLAHHNLLLNRNKKAQTPSSYLDLSLTKLPAKTKNSKINTFYNMMTKMTFSTSNDPTFGKQKGSKGFEYHLDLVPRAVVFVPSQAQSLYPYILKYANGSGRRRRPDSIASSGSSNSLNAVDAVNNNLTQQPLEKRLKKAGRWCCPFLNCYDRFNDIDQHLFDCHNGYLIETKAKTFVENIEKVPFRYRADCLVPVGHVDLAVEAEIMSPQYVWWGPKCFQYQSVKFFLVLYKWMTETQDPKLVFGVSANVDEAGRKYYSDVEIMSPSLQGNHFRKAFRGKVASLTNPAQHFSHEGGHDQDVVYHRFSDLEQYVFPDRKVWFRMRIYKSKRT